MRKRLIAFTLCLFMISAFVAGCDSRNGVNELADTDGAGTRQNVQKAQDRKLVIWSYEDGIANVIDSYKKYNKDLEIELKTFSYDKGEEAYIKALADGAVPDLLILDSTYFGQYVANEALQNLLEPPFNAGDYKKDFPESLWNMEMSLDGKKLLALPIATSPRVTFYRADIMKQNGFPYEPEELGKFMEDPENWLAIAKKLKKNDQYIVQWTDDPVEIMGTTVGVFDRKLNFLRNTDLFVKGLNLSKELHKYTLESNIGLWSELGRNAVKSGKISMFYLGTWAVDLIKEYSPESKGKWRVTRLPFGMYGWSAATSIAMNGQSLNKEEAWKFIQYTITHKDVPAQRDSIPGYIPARKKAADLKRVDDFLGGQKTYALYDSLTDKMKEYPLTPLDDKALKILKEEVDSAVENDIDSRASMASVTKRINKELGEEKKVLLDYMNR